MAPGCVSVPECVGIEVEEGDWSVEFTRDSDSASTPCQHLRPRHGRSHIVVWRYPGLCGPFALQYRGDFGARGVSPARRLLDRTVACRGRCTSAGFAQKSRYRLA